MYIEYFKLNEAPFTLTPNPRYLFMSELHREGLAHLLYGVQQPGGFVQLTGEVGAGKTTLCRCLIDQLPQDTDVALILNPKLTALELLATVCDELGIAYPPETGSIKVLIDALNRHLLETHARNRRTVLIIDEAQNLNDEVLEQIRLLTNLETSQEKLLQIILLGQPELLTLLRRKNLRQLSQRITARYHLKPLSRDETHAYIKHRLLVAGRREPLFTPRALNRVYRMSGGIPRVINIICDRALLGAYAQDTHMIDASIIRKAARETRGEASWHRGFRFEWPAMIVLFALIAATFFLYFPIISLPNNKNVSEATPLKNLSDGEGQVYSRVLADMLYSVPEGDTPSFTDLFALWGVKMPANSPEPSCAQGIIPGFECISLFGGWARLQRYDLPAILELLLPNGGRRRVVLCGLDGEKAVLIVHGRPISVSIPEIAMLWDGSFMLVWKPPNILRNLSKGATGESVRWIQRALDRVDGKPESYASGIFDEELKQRVLDFQKKSSLMHDGVVGNETLARLTLALEGPESLSLSGRARMNQ
jgi:general secretion pathway protein A